MNRTRRAVLAGMLLVCSAVSAGCGGSREEEAEEPTPAAGGEALDGLTRDQIREQVRPMSPEKAEELGIVDTTIHVESLTNPEDRSLLPDTARRPPPDSVP